MRRNTATRDNHRRTLARDRPACAICGEPIDYTIPYPHPDSFEADHIIPLDLGGPDILANKQATHRRCNRRKHARLVAPIVRRSGSLR